MCCWNFLQWDFTELLPSKLHEYQGQLHDPDQRTSSRENSQSKWPLGFTFSHATLWLKYVICQCTAPSICAGYNWRNLIHLFLFLLTTFGKIYSLFHSSGMCLRWWYMTLHVQTIENVTFYLTHAKHWPTVTILCLELQHH